VNLRYATPITLVDTDADAPITDPARLRALDGVRDDGLESFVKQLAEEPDFPDTTGITCDGGVFLRYDAATSTIHYTTEWTFPRDLTEAQRATVRALTVNMWQEGIGIAFNQTVLSDEHHVVVDREDQVGDKDLSDTLF
jgi:hypothetical protein